MPYEYRHAQVIRVVDGDSAILSIDLGNKVTWTDNFRLMGIDTPERGQPGHREATLHLVNLLGNKLSRVETHKPDKYGRWLADLYVPAAQGGELHINALMVADGHAKEYFGGAK